MISLALATLLAQAPVPTEPVLRKEPATQVQVKKAPAKKAKASAKKAKKVSKKAKATK
jgi:hypothetical protein